LNILGGEIKCGSASSNSSGSGGKGKISTAYWKKMFGKVTTMLDKG
jgi:hypothetical protein